jgi:hypothetical protein
MVRQKSSKKEIIKMLAYIIDKCELICRHKSDANKYQVMGSSTLHP